MTAAALTSMTAADAERSADRQAVYVLAQTEARRHLKGVALWFGVLGIALTGLSGRGGGWQGEVYESFPLLFVPLAAATFLAGVRSGGRDRRTDLPCLAEDAPLDATARATGRLLGMAPFVVATTLAVVAVEAGIRIEGGHWIGESPGRTDSAVHTIPELVQPIAFVALAAAAGIAAGRAFRRHGPIAVLGMIIGFMTWSVYWAFQFMPMAVFTLVQTAPIQEYAGPPGSDPDTFPADWLLARPDEFTHVWLRVYVDQWLAAGHVVYLLGLAALCTAAAVRGSRGRRWLVAGLAVVAIGVIVQLAATGFALTPGGTGPGQQP